MWDAGLGIRPLKGGQRSFPDSAEGGIPGPPDFTAYEKMAGEYRVMGIYPRGHLMEFVRPTLNRRGTAAAGSSTPGAGRKWL